MAVICAYATAIPGDFVWIDHVEIAEGGYRVTSSEDFRRLWTLTLDQYLDRRAGLPMSRGGYWRPVYALSISLDWLLWGDRAWGYHVQNVVWHLLVVVALYLLGRRMLEPLGVGRLVVFWGTLLFAVHPLGVHSVTWISGRKDAMCAVFGIGALLALSRLGADTAPRRRAPFWMLLSVGSMLLALGSKELASVVPLAALLVPWPTTGRSFLRWVNIGALWACVLAVAVYRMTVLGGVGLNARYPADSLIGNVATEATLWWHHLGRVLWPVTMSLSDAWPIAHTIGVREVSALLALAGVLVVLVRGAARGWAVMPAILWYVIWMLPATGVVPLRHVRADRYLYPAAWGLLLAAVFLVVHLWPRVPSGARVGWVKAAVPVATVSGLVLITAFHNVIWWRDASLFGHSVEEDPRHVEGRLGLAHLALIQRDHATAIAQSRVAIADGQDRSHAAYWSPFIAYSNLGLALYHSRQPAEAAIAFRTALGYRPAHPTAHYHVGQAAFALGRLDEARTHYRRALELRPDDFLTRSNLAITLIHSGDIKQGVALLRPLVQSQPGDVVNLTNLGSALLALGEFAEAEGYFERLVSAQPHDAVQRAKLAWCQWQTGKRSQARQNAAQAHRQAPDHPTVRHVRGLVVPE